MYKLTQNFKTVLFLCKTLKLLLGFKIAYFCCFSLRGNLDFLQK